MESKTLKFIRGHYLVNACDYLSSRWKAEFFLDQAVEAEAEGDGQLAGYYQKVARSHQEKAEKADTLAQYFKGLSERIEEEQRGEAEKANEN